MINTEEYEENLQTFENFFDFAIDVSDNTSGLKVPWFLVRSNQLYTRLTMTTASIIHLLPKNRIFPTNWEIWDFCSVASLARNLIENYHMLFYVSVEEVSDEERDFRLKLLTYHLNNEKYKLYLESKVDRETLEVFETNLPKSKALLENHSFFKVLSKENAKKVLKGNDAMYLTHKEISERIYFNTDEFKALYRLFSNHTHSSPLAYFSTSNERGRGNANEAEVEYLSMTTNLCIKYLSAAILDMTKLFPICLEKLDKKKYEFVKDKFESYK